jgi:hypothetical protein
MDQNISYDVRQIIACGVARTILDGNGLHASSRALHQACAEANVLPNVIDGHLRDLVERGTLVAAPGPRFGHPAPSDGQWYAATRDGYTKLYHLLDDARRAARS